MSKSTDLSSLNKQVSQIHGNGAVGIPAGTTSQRPTDTNDGLMRWNKTTKLIEYFGNARWNSILGETELKDAFVEQNNPIILEDLNASGKKLTNVGNPTDQQDAVTINYLEQRFAAGTGINAEKLGGFPASWYASQFDLDDIKVIVDGVKEDLDDHLQDHDNPHQVTKDQVGLDQADNTSDVDKPLSKDMLAALYGVPNTGVEPLATAKGKVNRSGDNMDGNLNMNDNHILAVGNFIGSVWWFALPNAPAGFLKANGAAVSRTTYARLFARIGTTFGAGDGSTTFNLPDLRGMFVRGLDEGRGIDAQGGRALGSVQAHTLASHNHTGIAAANGGHTHNGTTSNSGAHSHQVPLNGYSDSDHANNPTLGANKTTRNYMASTDVSGAHQHAFTTDLAGAHTHDITLNPSGGAETRPINMALVPCIMY